MSDTTSEQRRRLGELLLELGLVTEAQLQRALDVQRMGGGRLGSILVRLRFLSERDFREVLQRQLGVEIVDASALTAPIVGPLSIQLMREHQVVPLGHDGETLTVGLRDPYDVAAIAAIRAASGYETVAATILPDHALERLLQDADRTWALAEDIRAERAFYVRALAAVEPPPVPAAEAAVALRPDAPPIDNLVAYALIQALSRRATELHVQRPDEGCAVRLRVDGALEALLAPPAALAGGIVGALRALVGGPDAAPGPWHGRGVVRIEGRRTLLRVATSPSLRGEVCTLRLSAVAAADDLGALRLSDAVTDSLRVAVSAPRGLVLVAGAPDDGTAALLRALAGAAATGARRVVLLEGSTDREVAGVEQIEAGAAGPALGDALSLAPDVILVDDGDDPAIARACLRAASQRIVVMAVQAAGAVEAIGRLIDLGAEPHALAERLAATVGVRTARGVCPSCAAPHVPDEEALAALGVLAAAGIRRGVGCAACRGTGLRGQVLLVEALDAALIRAQVGLGGAALREAAGGFEDLQAAGARAVTEGRLSLAELQRALS